MGRTFGITHYPIKPSITFLLIDCALIRPPLASTIFLMQIHPLCYKLPWKSRAIRPRLTRLVSKGVTPQLARDIFIDTSSFIILLLPVRAYEPTQRWPALRLALNRNPTVFKGRENNRQKATERSRWIRMMCDVTLSKEPDV